MIQWLELLPVCCPGRQGQNIGFSNSGIGISNSELGLTFSCSSGGSYYNSFTNTSVSNITNSASCNTGADFWTNSGYKGTNSGYTTNPATVLGGIVGGHFTYGVNLANTGGIAMSSNSSWSVIQTTNNSSQYTLTNGGAVAEMITSSQTASFGPSATTPQSGAGFDLSAYGGSNDLTLLLPAGTSAQRPSSPTAGEIRYNTSIPGIEAYYSSTWNTLGSGGGSGVTSVTGTAPVASSGGTTPAISITGVAGEVLAGSSPAFSATPTLGVNATTTGQLKLANGGTSGATTTVEAAQATTAWTLNLPSGPGTATYVLSTDGSGNTSWVPNGGASATINLGTSASATNPQRTSEAGTGFYSGTDQTVSVAANGVQAMQWDTVGSGVDYLSVTPGLSGTSPQISVGGSTTNQGIVINPKGTGSISITNAGNDFYQNFGLSVSSTNNYATLNVTKGLSQSGVIIAGLGSTHYGYIFGYTYGLFLGGNTNYDTFEPNLLLPSDSNVVDYVQIDGGATGTPGTATVSAAGSDTNVNLVLTAKGTGAVKATSPVQLPGYTVSTLPSGVTGMTAYVTDQTSSCPSPGGSLTGSGSVKCPVFYNGSAWVGM